jgi:hypothetical protein
MPMLPGALASMQAEDVSAENRISKLSPVLSGVSDLSEVTRTFTESPIIPMYVREFDANTSAARPVLDS